MRSHQRFFNDQVRHIIPPLSAELHKGQMGRVGVLGGCLEYTGAPYIAAISAMNTGCDLGFVLCSRDAAVPIKCYGPELIVLPLLRTTVELASEGRDGSEEVVEQISEQVMDWVERMTVLVVGPGLGRDKFVHKITRSVLKKCVEKKKTLVIDADGLWVIEQDLLLLSGYSNVILTPNVNEFNRLCKLVLSGISSTTSEREKVAKLSQRVEVPRLSLFLSFARSLSLGQFPGRGTSSFLISLSSLDPRVEETSWD
eukprot:TRINITY_DN1017_c0_g1_i3.p1 TRINITY_DN1017_c0_g1~~TRINITY_DN1017_c0_g1_i3.p1  ORF type:complete len:255 (+),score=50.12 TRINITY_DN1017_c0_g1_i3:137-901(+)